MAPKSKSAKAKYDLMVKTEPASGGVKTQSDKDKQDGALTVKGKDERDGALAAKVRAGGKRKVDAIAEEEKADASVPRYHPRSPSLTPPPSPRHGAEKDDSKDADAQEEESENEHESDEEERSDSEPGEPLTREEEEAQEKMVELLGGIKKGRKFAPTHVNKKAKKA
jgi:hypothetical protein